MINVIRNIIKVVKYWRVKLLLYRDVLFKIKDFFRLQDLYEKESKFLKSAYDELMIEYEKIKSLKVIEEGKPEFLNEILDGWYYDDWGEMRFKRWEKGYVLEQEGDQYSVFYKKFGERANLHDPYEVYGNDLYNNEELRIIKIVFNYKIIDMSSKDISRLNYLNVKNNNKAFLYESLFTSPCFVVFSFVHDEYLTIKIYEGMEFDDIIKNREILKKTVYLFGGFLNKILNSD